MWVEYNFILVRITLAALPNQYLRSDIHHLTYVAPPAPCWAGNVISTAQLLLITSSTLGKGEYKLGGLVASSTTDPNFIRYSQYIIELIKTYYTSLLTNSGLFRIM